jgi:quercetin dioxygenase-like cupin family protein
MLNARSSPSQVLARIVALVIAILPLAACGLGAPPGPTVRHQAHCDIPNTPAAVDVYQALWTFTPGTWTSRHSHPGPVCVSTLEGSVTFRFVDPPSETTVAQGQSFIESANGVHSAGTWSGPSAVLLVTNLTPRGKPQATVVDPAQTATRTYNNQATVDQLPTQLTVSHAVLDFGPGAWTPAESHGGKTLHTVLSGTVTLRVNGADKTFAVGQFWSVDAGQVYALGNTGSTPASVFVSSLLPKGS